MKLILMTAPQFFIEEHRLLTAFFDEGLEILHLRKPNTEPVYSERLLTLLPDEYRKKVIVHDHFYLKTEYNLKGIHLNSRNPEPPHGYRGHVSCSCHSADDILLHKKRSDYVLFSPVFDSISKNGYTAKYSLAELKEWSKQRIIDKKVMALGGVDAENIPQLKDYGFGGAVVLGSIWSRFDIHNSTDFKDLINYFRKLKKIAD